MEENLVAKIIRHKALYLTLALIVAVELLWAGWVLGKPLLTSSKQPLATAPNLISQTPTTISLVANKQTVKKGEKVIVDIVVTSSKPTDGTDVVLKFDNNLLLVASSSAGPVKPSTLYSEYPFNSIELGNISISGISSASQGIIPNGVFGTIEFIAKKVYFFIF